MLLAFVLLDGRQYTHDPFLPIISCCPSPSLLLRRCCLPRAGVRAPSLLSATSSSRRFWEGTLHRTPQSAPLEPGLTASLRKTFFSSCEVCPPSLFLSCPSTRTPPRTRASPGILPGVDNEGLVLTARQAEGTSCGECTEKSLCLASNRLLSGSRMGKEGGGGLVNQGDA